MFRTFILYASFLLLHQCLNAQNVTVIDLPGKHIEVTTAYQVAHLEYTAHAGIKHFMERLNMDELQHYLNGLSEYKSTVNPDDWIYYQAIRKIAQHLSPKADNYDRYTIIKWWLLVRSGYDARLFTSSPYILLYVQSDEQIYNIPYRMMGGKQYVCLNYHDYGEIDFSKFLFADVTPEIISTSKQFSYRVNHIPDLPAQNYSAKELQFVIGTHEYSFRIQVNPQVKNIFQNYPVANYALHFNMPLSRTTYQSLIPELKKYMEGRSSKDGVEFLMNFTRYAFVFKTDTEIFGKEKRLTPEQTLLYDFSDCEDRAALFYYLVKEIYNLPMLVITYPRHVTVAVQLEKPVGKTIDFNGNKYTICEPSPQYRHLRIGETLPGLLKSNYTVEYAYTPGH